MSLSSAAEIESDPCPGEGRCHGCLAWCDRCGDVGAVCNYPECDHHHCTTCRILITSRNESDGNRPTWCKACEHAYEVRDLEARFSTALGLRFYDLALKRLASLVQLAGDRLAELTEGG